MKERHPTIYTLALAPYPYPYPYPVPIIMNIVWLTHRELLATQHTVYSH